MNEYKEKILKKLESLLLKFKIFLIPYKRKVLSLLRKIKHNRKYQAALALGAVVIVFITTLIVLTIKPSTDLLNKELNNVINLVTYSVDTPSEEPIETPNKKYEWPGTSSDPKYINLPTINTSGYIINVGVDQNNAVAVPPNVHLAGWFVNSVKPGENGLSIIDGHVDGTNIGGMFKNLKDLNIGDKFTVEMGDGTRLNYTVKDKQTVTNADAANVLFSQLPNVKSQLNLITCTGTYLYDQQTYDNRLIVMAELES